MNLNIQMRFVFECGFLLSNSVILSYRNSRIVYAAGVFLGSGSVDTKLSIKERDLLNSKGVTTFRNNRWEAM